MGNTADVTGGKPIAVLLQSISGVSTINPVVAFYDIFYFVSETTRDRYKEEKYRNIYKHTYHSPFIPKGVT
jgi:hypothetical protein